MEEEENLDINKSETKKNDPPKDKVVSNDGVTATNDSSTNRTSDPAVANTSPIDTLITPTLRTYKQDVKEVVQNQDITTTRILLEEQRRKASAESMGYQTSIKSGKNKILVIISLILIAGTGGIFGYKYLIPPPSEAPKFIIQRPTFVSVDEQAEIKTELRNKRDIYNDIERLLIEPIQEKSLREVILTKTKTIIVGDQPKQQTELVTTEEFFSLLEGRAPSSLIRSLSTEFMFGILGINVAEPFVLFKVKDFENSFASLLQWEPTMAQDFQPIFFTNYQPEELLQNPQQNSAPQVENINNASSTASSTQSINVAPKLSFDPTKFEDKVIFNTDARIIKDEFEGILFFYTFINDEFLIFAKDSKTLEEVVGRLRQAKLIR